MKFPLVLLHCCLVLLHTWGNGAATNLKLNVFTYSSQVLNIGGQVFNCWRVTYFLWLKWSCDNLYRNNPSSVLRAQAGGRSRPLLSYEVTLSEYLSVTKVVLVMTFLLMSALVSLENFSVCLQWLQEKPSTYTHRNQLKYHWADKIQPLLGQTPTTSTAVDWKELMRVAASPASLNRKINCSSSICLMDFIHWPILLPPFPLLLLLDLILY